MANAAMQRIRIVRISPSASARDPSALWAATGASKRRIGKPWRHSGEQDWTLVEGTKGLPVSERPTTQATTPRSYRTGTRTGLRPSATRRKAVDGWGGGRPLLMLIHNRLALVGFRGGDGHVRRRGPRRGCR